MSVSLESLESYRTQNLKTEQSHGEIPYSVDSAVAHAALPAIRETQLNAVADASSIRAVKVDPSEKDIKSEIHFVKELVSNLEKSYEGNSAVIAIKKEIASIEAEDLEPCEKLEKIKNIFVSELEKDPKDIKSDIKEICLESKNIEKISGCITIFKEIKILSFAGNKIVDVPSVIFEELKKLEIINLAYNEIKSLPKSITKLKELTRLILMVNQLTSLPEGFAEMQNLNFLSVVNNPINDLESFRERKKQHIKIITIDARGTQITSDLNLNRCKVLFTQSSDELPQIPETLPSWFKI